MYHLCYIVQCLFVPDTVRLQPIHLPVCLAWSSFPTYGHAGALQTSLTYNQLLHPCLHIMYGDPLLLVNCAVVSYHNSAGNYVCVTTVRAVVHSLSQSVQSVCRVWQPLPVLFTSSRFPDICSCA
jgi:hypothetical protein